MKWNLFFRRDLIDKGFTWLGWSAYWHLEGKRGYTRLLVDLIGFFIKKNLFIYLLVSPTTSILSCNLFNHTLWNKEIANKITWLLINHHYHFFLKFLYHIYFVKKNDFHTNTDFQTGWLQWRQRPLLAYTVPTVQQSYILIKLSLAGASWDVSCCESVAVPPSLETILTKAHIRTLETLHADSVPQLLDAPPATCVM